MHTRQWLWLFFLLVFLITSLGCVRRTTDLAADTLPDQSALCAKMTDEGLRNQCFMDAAARFGSPDTCASITNSGFQDDCVRQLAIQVGDALYCARITDVTIRDPCFETIALSQLNPATCASITDPGVQTNCVQSLLTEVTSSASCEGLVGTNQTMCLTAVATKTGDDAACRLLSASDRDDCLNNAARQGGHVDFCTLIADSTKQNTCIADLIGENVSPTSCPLLETLSARDACFGRLATQLDDLSYCGRIVNIPARNQCFGEIAIARNDSMICGRMILAEQGQFPADYCYDTIGRAINSTLVCYKVRNLDLQKGCIDAVIGTQGASLSDCEGFESGSEEADACYGNVAIKDQNLAVCGLASDEVGCVANYALYGSNLSVCQTTQLSYDARFECQSRYHVARVDQDGCDAISFSYWRHSCYAGIAGELDDETLCQQIPASSIEPLSACWTGVAETRKDASLCENSTDSILRARCHARVGALTNDPAACEAVPLGRLVTDPLRHYYRNICWIEIAQLSASQGYCFNIDENNSPSQYQSCLCEVTGNCQLLGRLTVSVETPDEDIGGYVAVLTRDLQFFADYAIALDTRSVEIPSIPDGNYGVRVVDRQGEYESDLQTVEILNGSEQFLTFVMAEVN